MDISKLPNPYDYRNPVSDAALFAGRIAELDSVAYELDQAGLDRPSVYIAVHGQRAAGKTSLLNRTEDLARERGLLPVRVTLVPSDATPSAFYRKVYEELVAAVTDEGGTLGGPGAVTPAKIRRVFSGATPENDFPLEFPEALSLSAPGGPVSEAALRADLRYVVRVLGRPIALLIDEAQLVAGHEEVLSVLRALGTRLNGFVFVLAGTSSLLTRITEVFSPLLRQFKEIKIERFVESEDVSNCMLLPLRGLGLDADCFPEFNGTQSELVHLTDGNPYEIQLYCHEMFARWQKDAAMGMALTAEMLEDVRSRMESGRDVLDRRLIRSVKKLSPERLHAFNVLSSALDHASVDEVWFAYNVVGQPSITREVLDQCRAELIADGAIDESEVVRLSQETELFDDIYVRLWTINKLGRQRHHQLMGRGEFHSLLTRRLGCLLNEITSKPARVLQTCCPKMGEASLNTALFALESLADKGAESVPYATQFVHEAILRTGIPAALDITTVTCAYGGTTGIRWLYSADADDFRLEHTPGFLAAARRIAALGGELKAERTRLPLKPWPRISEWLRLSTGTVRATIAENHLTASYTAYGNDDLSGTRQHLAAAYDLDPRWEPANNILYVSLAAGEPGIALEWVGRALDLAQHPKDKALSRYNAAMAYLLEGDRETAGHQLAMAAGDLAPLPVADCEIDYLLTPQTADGTATLSQEREVDLAAAIERARTMVGVEAADRAEAADGAEGADRAQGADTAVATSAPALAPAPEAGTEAEPEPEATDAREPRPLTVLVIATEWWSAHGGLSTFNRDLCRALAAAGAQVYCVVLAVGEGEIAAAKADGVTLLCPPLTPGAPEYVQLTRRPQLPEGTVPDLVIGHSRITGPAAELQVSDFFPDARRLHFIHMAPDEIEWHKLDRENDAARRAEGRTEDERRLGGSAHRVVAVGPRLHSRFLNELSGEGIAAPLRIDPGFDVANPTPGVPPAGRPLKVLLVGRTEDAELKGLDLAARACGRVATWREKAKVPAIGLVVRGAPKGTGTEQRKELRSWAANPKLDVVVREYSSEQERLTGDMSRASLVIMPSRKEGFGLVGVEAITMGVPTLVSEESGLAEFLREKLDGETAARVIVPMSGDDDEDTETWARAIDRVMGDLPTAFRRAAELRNALAGTATWADAAAVLLAEAADDRGGR
ncbi:glycosyltransferase [Streptomyces sp. NPDC050636]|uniref:glycosyltransferase n=1 Tax=Streptomyces sp. NPDC050636 TaxID=3154510 RepID=UPI00342CB048